MEMGRWSRKKGHYLLLLSQPIRNTPLILTILCIVGIGCAFVVAGGVFELGVGVISLLLHLVSI